MQDNDGTTPRTDNSLFRKSRLISKTYDGAVSFFGLNYEEEVEDWNSRRIKFVVKRFGSIKSDKLVSTSVGGTPNLISTPGLTLKPSIQRQMSLMTCLGLPDSTTQARIPMVRNSALRTLGMVVKQSTYLCRSPYHEVSANGMAPGLVTPSAVIRLPAGTIYSQIPSSNSSIVSQFYSPTNWIGLDELPRSRHRRLLSTQPWTPGRLDEEDEAGYQSSRKPSCVVTLPCIHHTTQTPSMLEETPDPEMELEFTPIKPRQSNKTSERIFFPDTPTSLSNTTGFSFQAGDSSHLPITPVLPGSIKSVTLKLPSRCKVNATSLLPTASGACSPAVNEYVEGNNDSSNKKLSKLRFPSQVESAYLRCPLLPSRSANGGYFLSPTFRKIFTSSFDALGVETSPLQFVNVLRFCSIDGSLSPATGRHAFPRRSSSVDALQGPFYPSREAFTSPHPRAIIRYSRDRTSASPRRLAASSGLKRLWPSRLSERLCTGLSTAMDASTKEIYERVSSTLNEYRPFFTYWISFVHIVVCTAACLGFGLAPVGLHLDDEVAGVVLVASSTVEKVCRAEEQNPWIGPRPADLIKLGAPYSPCMRPDETLRTAFVETQKQWDRQSGCCIRNDGGGCHQTSRTHCSPVLSRWLAYSDSSLSQPASTTPAGSLNAGAPLLQPTRPGPVCGLDPNFCEEPRSSGPFVWSRLDVVDWPICRRSSNVSGLGAYVPHMQCEVTAKPCCVGIKGECIITTSSHCTFLRGYYHAEASLCSQVNCLQRVCGMMPFKHADRPDQLYRIFISLFLHAGILHLILTLSVQLTLMRDLEKLLGWLRVALIYLLSGCFSNLVSCILSPYHVHTGPTGSLFALLGVTFVEFLQSWHLVLHPWISLLRQCGLIFILLSFGLLPWLDNYSNLAGFLSGLILAHVFLPFLGLALPGHHHHQQPLPRRVCLILSSAALWSGLGGLLCLLFTHLPPLHCTWCSYLNCLPLTQHLCGRLRVNVTEPTPCIPPNR